MSQQIRHGDPHTDALSRLETTLGEVRQANLCGRLYLHPRSRRKRKALRQLRKAGLAERVPKIATSLGGWFARTLGE